VSINYDNEKKLKGKDKLYKKECAFYLLLVLDAYPKTFKCS